MASVEICKAAVGLVERIQSGASITLDVSSSDRPMAGASLGPTVKINFFKGSVIGSHFTMNCDVETGMLHMSNP